MNSVSWFIYIAQISGSLGAMFAVLGVLLMIVVMVRFAFPYVYNTMECKEPGERKYQPPRPISRGYMALAVGFLIMSCLMPERNTMYAIAASQVGEQIIRNEAVQGVASDATKALHEWIRRQIEPATETRRK